MKGPKYGVIKASVRGCSVEDRDKFSNSHAMILVSVGQPYHESEKFLATIDLVNDKFKFCTLMVCDTLQRHNFIIDDSESSMSDAYSFSLIEGDNWLFRNKDSINKLKISYDVKRWDYWMKKENYAETHKKIQSFYKTDSAYRDEINSSIEEYLVRRASLLTSECFIDKAKNNCLNYLLEECAAMLLWVNEGYNFEIYPNARNSAMRATFEKFIQPYYGDILKPISLRFKRYSSYCRDYDAKNNFLYKSDSLTIS